MNAIPSSPGGLVARPLGRRSFIRRGAVALGALGGLSEGLLAGLGESPAAPPIGLGAYSCGQAWSALRSGEHDVPFSDTATFLEYARTLGAGGIQAVLRPGDKATASAVRARSEKLGMYFEGELRLPKDETDVGRFAAEAGLLREAGAPIARAAALSGRRYETFKTAAEFGEFRNTTQRSLKLAEPVLRRTQLRLALENHKDFLGAEMADLMRSLESEWIGVCVDTGNNVALLEEPAAVVEALAPWAASVHLKDMAIEEVEDGFLLSEVPLGAGFLDLPRLIGTLRRANPRIAFNLEMITRDPLRIPCLTPGYWGTLEDVRGVQLAAALRRVRRFRPRRPLPVLHDLSIEGRLGAEEQNNRVSIQFAHERLGI